jgi:carbon storage regulator CsrA
MGLSLTRRLGEAIIMIGKDIGPIKITILGHGTTVNHIKVNIEAPQNIDIFREELLTTRTERRKDSHECNK